MSNVLVCLFVSWGFRARRLRGHFAPITYGFILLTGRKDYRETSVTDEGE